MALKETYVRARVDDRLKRESEQIFDALGLTRACPESPRFGRW